MTRETTLQNLEAIDLLDRLMKKLNCKKDEELATTLSLYFKEGESSIDRTHFSRWRRKGIPKVDKGLILYILDKCDESSHKN